MPLIWFPDRIIDDAIDSSLDNKYYLKVFCYLSFHRIFSFKAIIPYKYLCEFIGIKADKHMGEKIAIINEVFEDMQWRGIILDEVKFEGINDVAVIDLNPNFFVPPTKAQKTIIGDDSSVFRYFTEENYKKIITYDKDNYKPSRRNISSDRLLLIYMYLLSLIHYRIDGIDTVKMWIKYPLGGIFSYKSVADILDYEEKDVAEACEILRDDLELIFYGEPLQIRGARKLISKKRIIVEKLPANDNRFDWQQEYLNEHLYYVKWLLSEGVRNGQTVNIEHPPEITEYLQMLADKKTIKTIKENTSSEDLPVDELF